MRKTRNYRVRAFPQDVDGGGFMLSVATWQDSQLYGVPAYAFVQQSEHFESLVHAHIESSTATATHPAEDLGPIHLNDEDLTSVDFERLLSIIYPW